ncbi:hypothetical protein [Pelagicoccus mobilis]|uniref:Uncharacterized protein n=1 Tax=Pelagicoccus mobilis TaxID=415221 RepID=A0A934S7C3_9BACT|nr:hypothetical protein [Pelagicoccus mobilis]MBK1880248.1 hypothetical protein [Pelagicoccus mobilis]
MALRLGDYVVRGEMDNRHGYATVGWLELRGSGEFLRVELTGDLSEDLKGKRIRFECSKSGYKSLEQKSASEGAFPDRYVGATATMTADHRVKVFDCPIGEFYMRCKMGEPAPTFWRRCLYLEWYGNCGRVLVELPDASVWIVEGEGEEERMHRLPDIEEGPEEVANWEGEDGASEIEIVEVERVDDEKTRVTRTRVSKGDEQSEGLGESEDLYSLFSDEFKEMIGVSDGKADGGFREEVTQMEEVWEGKANGDSLRDLIGQRPDFEALSEAEAENVLKIAVGKMGLLNIAYHVCEHMTPREACRYLWERLGDCQVHHQMEGGSWFCHFSTADGCPRCAEVMEREELDFESQKENTDED